MEITIKATDSGKTIRVEDRIAAIVALDQFLDLDESVAIKVASNDGKTGEIDVWYAITGAANTLYGDSPNVVQAGQVFEVDGD